MLIEFKFGQFTAGVGYLYRNNMSEPEVQPDELMRKFRCVLMFIKMNRFENIAMKYKYALQSSLVNKKGRIMNKWDELKKSSKEVFENFPKIDINNAFIFDILESIVHSAKILKFVDLDDRNLQCEYEEILNSVENSGWSLGKVSIDLETLEGSVIILLNFIYDLSKILPELKKYVGFNGLSVALDEDFRQYLKIGYVARNSNNYKKTNVYKLEHLLMERIDFLKSFGSEPPSGESNSDTTFIALIAPSLAGKTQSAFIIDKIRCLYFPLDFSQSRQRIYSKFGNLSSELKNAADQDFLALKAYFPEKLVKTISQNDWVFSNISSHNLLSKFKNFKFFSLGFLVKLIEDSEADADGLLKNGTPWMQYHAERKGFYYTSKSLNEVLANPELLDKIRSKYYVFLDEFVGEHWAVLIRNISRCLWMSTVVANTNSDITNLLGMVHASGSRGREWDIWSIVIIFLDKTDWKLLFDSFHHISNVKLSDKINSIVEKSSNIVGVANIEEVFRKASLGARAHPERAEFARFFRDFIEEMIPKLRPGISYYFARVIMKYDLSRKYKLPEFINYLLNGIKDFILERKHSIQSKPQGKMATLALYLSNAYDQNAVNPGIEHRKTYLNHHLFYLINPVDKRNIFLTYREPDEKKLNIIKNDERSGSGQFEIWKAELTFFDFEEVFTILACLFIKPSHSIAYELGQGADENKNYDWNTATTANPLALKLDGNAFEVLAAVSIIDSSHRRHGSKEATLAGQDGVNFIKNLVGNLINDDSYVKTKSINLAYPSETSEFSVEKFLENCFVPFLYPANLKVPDFLEKLTREGIINVGACARTADKKTIDFEFGFEYENSPSPTSSKRNLEKYFVVGECKNWTESLKSVDLIKILEKAYREKKSFFSLIFCNSVVKSPSTGLKDFCLLKKDINVYRFRRRSGEVNSFDVKAFCEGKNEKYPEMVCFIFEMNVINTKVFIELEDEENKNMKKISKKLSRYIISIGSRMKGKLGPKKAKAS